MIVCKNVHPARPQFGPRAIISSVVVLDEFLSESQESLEELILLDVGQSHAELYPDDHVREHLHEGS